MRASRRDKIAEMVFDGVSSLGVPLENIIWELEKRGIEIPWPSVISKFLARGWSVKKLEGLIREALQVMGRV